MRALALLRPTVALRRLGVQWALVALLAAALMPTFARIAQTAGPTDRASICQAAGSGTSPSQGDGHAPGDACALCSLAHTTPVLAGAAPAAVAVLAYAPPAPPTNEPVRTSAAQARAPSARAPPPLA